MSAVAVEGTPRRPLRRSEYGTLAGVLAGIAESTGASAPLLRVLFVLAAVRVPWLTAAYALAAVALPGPASAGASWGRIALAGRLLGLVALLWAIGSHGAGSWLGFHHGPAAWLPLAGLAVVASTALLTPWTIAPRPARAAVVGALPVLGTTALLAAGVALVPTVRWDALLAPAVLVAGAALLLSARAGAARQFVAPAALLAIAACLASAAGVRLQGGVGDVTVAPNGPTVVRRAAGDVTIDLTHLPPAITPVTVTASTGVGDVTVSIPAGWS